MLRRICLLAVLSPISACAATLPAPQPGVALVLRGPGCLSSNSLMSARWLGGWVTGAEMEVSPGASCTVPLDMFIGFARAVYVVQGAQVTVPPTHGTVQIDAAGGPGRVVAVYRSTPGFTGADGFAVRLLPSGEILNVPVTVGPTPAAG